MPCTMAEPTSFLTLPAELQTELVGMVLKFDSIVTMREPEQKPVKYERPKRKSRRTKKVWNSLAMFATSKEVHVLGLDLFWRVKTFDFVSIHELETFLGQCHTETRDSIRHLTLFRGFSLRSPSST